MVKERETVGKIASELMVKPVESETPFEQMSEQLSDWDKNIFECVERCKKYYAGDFYVVVITKKEKLMNNVIRNYFLGTIACPTPTWDQTVFAFNRSDESIDFLWTVPDKATCLVFSQYRTMVHPSEHQLLKFVLDFEDGTLLDIARKRNGETETPPVIVMDTEA
jgi:hypothetical protein